MKQKSKLFKALKNKKILFYFLSILIVFVLFQIKVSKMAVDGWSNEVKPFKKYLKFDKEIKEIFNDSNQSREQQLNSIFKYFTYANKEYTTSSKSLVFYPGEISSRGRFVNGIEGFARFFPLAASWMNSYDMDSIFINKEYYDLTYSLSQGLLNGTNPDHDGYWGEINHKDQKIVEAADIALGIWLSREQIWFNFDKYQKDQIVNWLSDCIHKNIVDNNWNLFPITIVKVLESLGYNNSSNLDYVKKLYSDYKENHYLGNGWFDDPPKGIDYYNAWSIHYSLFWIDQIDTDFDHEFIKKSHSDFVKFYKYFFSPNGFPIMGRSICYRLAAPSPIVSGSLLNPKDISKGLANRTLYLTWNHFISNNALEFGKLTQGYYKDDLRLLDSYSGAGSCLWSLRSLITAFYVNKHNGFFNVDDELLPVEKHDYNIFNETIGWSIIGDKSNQETILRIKKNEKNPRYNLIEYGTVNEIKEAIYKRPTRPNNTKALYENYEYSSNAQIITN